MIRLSEALAKLECVDEVTVKHIRESKRLLQKSIITVEQPDVDLEEGDDANLGMDIDEPPPLMAALNALDNNDDPPPQTRMHAFSFFYLYIMHIMHLLTLYIIRLFDLSSV